jgi:anti-sigma factor RsiW
MTDVENPTRQACPYEGENEVRSRYLAGKLSERDAEVFEAHYFDCDRCAEAVEVGTKLRSAFGNEGVKLAAPPVTVPSRRVLRTWLPLAAAAAVALGAFGIWQLARSPLPHAEGSVYRGGATRETVVQVTRALDGGMTVTWAPSPDASAYAVRVLSSDGAEVWKTETVESNVWIDAAALSAGSGKSLLVEVDTLDARRRVIATSGPTKLR